MLNSTETAWVSLSGLSAIFPIGRILRCNFPTKIIDWIKQSSYISYRVKWPQNTNSITIELSATEWHPEDGRNFTTQDFVSLPQTIVIQISDLDHSNGNDVNLLELIKKNLSIDSNKPKKPRIDWLSRKVKNQIRSWLNP